MSAFGNKADIPGCTAHVRFRGQSGHDVLHRTCPLLTQSGHSRRRASFQMNAHLSRPAFKCMNVAAVFALEKVYE